MDERTTQSATEIAPQQQPVTYPLSFTQRRLWFLDKLEPGKSVYNVSEAWRLRGSLDRAALARSVSTIVRRHESLRTTFAEVDGSPVQIVAPELAIEIPLDDLTGLPAGDREPEAQRRVSDRASEPFDLEHGPLLRLALVRLSPDEHVLFIGMHHIVSEGGWSMGIFLKELTTLYNADVALAPATLPELQIQYGDYAVWQQEWLQGEVREQLLDYWTKSLKGAPALLEMPSDRARPPVQSYAGSRETHTLPAGLKTALSDFSRREGATLFMTVFTAFNTLLARYSSQEDVVVGVSVAGRGSPETHDLIGFFVNTLAVRTDLSDDPSFRDLLRRTIGTCTGAYENEDLPYEVLVEVLNPERSLAYPPLFQVMFAYQNAPREDPRLSGLQASAYEIEARTSMFDLTLFVWERPEGLRLTAEYNTDLFDRASMQRLLGHLEVLLQGVIRNPDEAVTRLPLLSDAERRTVVSEWNSTFKSYPDRRMHQLFEEQVAKSPDATALVFQGATLSYAELNRRANQLARHLMQKGVAQGSVVGLCMERSFEMVIAMLGVIKAGASYVPYDPELPASRLSTLFEDSTPVCLIALQRFQPILSAYSGPVVFLDSATPELAGLQSSNLDLPIGPKDSIYAIYTSGSTGLPKAAINTHEAVVNRVLWMDDEYRLTPADRVMQKTPYTFDVSVWEFYWPIITGATLVIAEPGGHRDPSYLARLIADQGITTLHFVPSMLREFLDSADPKLCASLRRVICSGEALPPDLRQKFFQLLRAELHNLYGPTEAAVDVTYWDCSREAPCPSVPIGRPIANATTYILDRHFAPVPIGVPGELYLGGIPVGKGYMNRAELTAQRFLPDPFDSRPEARLYRTGDRARFLADGNIEYLGRNDNQIKLRGFRIELGEIESTLLLNGDVRSAAVAVRQDHNGDKFLVGYVVSAGAALDARALKAFLKDRLPEYMVPAFFVFLDSLPLLSNGKLNRNALPAPEQTGAPSAREFVAPRDATERKLVEIWEKLLNQRPIGIRDDFFDLGGHSLLLIRLIAQMQKEFGQRLPVATVFVSPTIEALAAVLSGKKESAAVCRVIPLKPEGSRPPFICVGASPLFLPLARLLGPDQPFCGFDLTELNKIKLPNPCRLEDIAAYVVEGIREYQPQGPYCIGGWCLYGVLAYEAARQLAAQGHEVQLLTLLDSPNLSYARALTSSARLQMKVQRWWFHLSNMVQAGPSEMAPYVRDRLAVVKGKFQRKREREGIEMGLQYVDERLMDLDPILFYAASHYDPPPYSGTVLMVQAEETPRGKHWQIGQQWRQPLVGKSVVHCVPGGHDGMFKQPHVETLAAKMRETFEEAARAQAKRSVPRSHDVAVLPGPSNQAGGVEEALLQEPAAR